MESKDEEIYKLQNELLEVRSSFKVESSELRMQIKVERIVEFSKKINEIELDLLSGVLETGGAPPLLKFHQLCFKI